LQLACRTTTRDRNGGVFQLSSLCHVTEEKISLFQCVLGRFLHIVCTVCQEKLWLPPPCQCSTSGWMELWAAWPSGRCPCSWQGGWN